MSASAFATALAVIGRLSTCSVATLSARNVPCDRLNHVLERQLPLREPVGRVLRLESDGLGKRHGCDVNG